MIPWPPLTLEFAGLCLVAFVAMTALDYVYAEWARCVGTKEATKAGLWAIAIILLSGVVTTSYVTNFWLMVPAMLGAFVGTYISVWRKE